MTTDPQMNATANQPIPESSSNGNSEPLVSRLPVNQPRLRRIVRKFPAQLEEQLTNIELAIGNSDFERLAELAHWVKGAGGTVGFPEFTKPATELENMIRSEDLAGTRSALAEIRHLSSRIQIPDELPEDADIQPIGSVSTVPTP